MSSKLAPSKSTVYVSNLPFSLTNSDLHQIFQKYGKVVKVTVMKDKVSRQSKGVAFVLFLDRDGASSAVKALNKTKMFERTITCTIAKDNGRAPEFIRRREYQDKSRCYECGEEGHLSYKCPKNLFGEREPPPKKIRKRKKDGDDDNDDEEVYTSDDEVTTAEANAMEDSLATAIKFQQAMMAKDMEGSSSFSESSHGRKRYKKDAYFSDEEELDD